MRGGLGHRLLAGLLSLRLRAGEQLADRLFRPVQLLLRLVRDAFVLGLGIGTLLVGVRLAGLDDGRGLRLGLRELLGGLAGCLLGGLVGFVQNAGGLRLSLLDHDAAVLLGLGLVGGDLIARLLCLGSDRRPGSRELVVRLLSHLRGVGLGAGDEMIRLVASCRGDLIGLGESLGQRGVRLLLGGCGDLVGLHQCFVHAGIGVDAGLDLDALGFFLEVDGELMLPGDIGVHALDVDIGVVGVLFLLHRVLVRLAAHLVGEVLGDF